MLVSKIEDYKGGWYVGNFKPSAHKTKDFEVAYMTHKAGEKWPTHYHQIATEINFLISGSMRVCGEDIFEGEVFVIEPGEIASPEFYTDCQLVVVKTPSIPGDKYEVKE